MNHVSSFDFGSGQSLFYLCLTKEEIHYGETETMIKVIKK